MKYEQVEDFLSLILDLSNVLSDSKDVSDFEIEDFVLTSLMKFQALKSCKIWN